jgi:hypothetical protein
MSGSQSNKSTEVTTKRKAAEQGGGNEAKRTKAQRSTQSAEAEQPIRYLLEALLPPTFPISSNSIAAPTNGMIPTLSNSIAVPPDGPPPLEHPSVFLLGQPTSVSAQPQSSSNTSRPRKAPARPVPIRSFDRAQPHSLAPRTSTLSNAASNLSNHQIAAAKSQRLLQSLIQRDDEDIPYIFRKLDTHNTALFFEQLHTQLLSEDKRQLLLTINLLHAALGCSASTEPRNPWSSGQSIDFQEVVKLIDQSSLSANELYTLFCQKDDNNLTAFHRAFLSHADRTNHHRGVELVKLAVRKGMPFQWILNLLFMTHGVKKSPLQLIAEDSKVMEAILIALRAGDLGKSAALFLASDGRGRSFFEEVRQHPRCMEIFLEAFPADQQAKIIAPPVLRENEIKAMRAHGADKESKGSPVRPIGLQAPCAMFTGTQPAFNKTFSQALREFVDNFVVQPQITQTSPISTDDSMRSRSLSGSSPS